METNERLDNLERKLDLVLSLLKENTCRSYNLQEFCKEIGIGVKALRTAYLKNKMPIPAPYRTDGHDPKFTSEDVTFMKEFLNERKRVIR